MLAIPKVSIAVGASSNPSFKQTLGKVKNSTGQRACCTIYLLHLSPHFLPSSMKNDSSRMVKIKVKISLLSSSKNMITHTLLPAPLNGDLLPNPSVYRAPSSSIPAAKPAPRLSTCSLRKKRRLDSPTRRRHHHRRRRIKSAPHRTSNLWQELWVSSEKEKSQKKKKKKRRTPSHTSSTRNARAGVHPATAPPSTQASAHPATPAPPAAAPSPPPASPTPPSAAAAHYPSSSAGSPAATSSPAPHDLSCYPAENPVLASTYCSSSAYVLLSAPSRRMSC